MTTAVLCLVLIAGYADAAESGTGRARLPVERESSAGGFDTRRARLLATPTSPNMLEGDIDSGGYAYRRRWQHYNACLAKGVKLDEANRYFAQSDEIVADEWPVLMQIRTYFAFKDTVLTKAASKRLAEVLKDYKNNAPRSRTPYQFAVTRR